MENPRQGSFTVSYPLGIEDAKMKPMMHEFTKMMFSGFAHYDLIESVIVTYERVYVIAQGEVKEYALHKDYGLQYITSHAKESFTPPRWWTVQFSG